MSGITYTQAVAENRCLDCGRPASGDDSYGAPYCLSCKRKKSAKIADDMKRDPQRFRW